MDSFDILKHIYKCSFTCTNRKMAVGDEGKEAECQRNLNLLSKHFYYFQLVINWNNFMNETWLIKWTSLWRNDVELWLIIDKSVQFSKQRAQQSVIFFERDNNTAPREIPHVRRKKMRGGSVGRSAIRRHSFVWYAKYIQGVSTCFNVSCAPEFVWVTKRQCPRGSSDQISFTVTLKRRLDASEARLIPTPTLDAREDFLVKFRAWTECVWLA